MKIYSKLTILLVVFDRGGNIYQLLVEVIAGRRSALACTTNANGIAQALFNWKL